MCMYEIINDVAESMRTMLPTCCIYLGSCAAMIIWNTPTQDPRLPSQNSGLGSNLSRTSNALHE